MTDWQYFALWDEPGSSPEAPYGLARVRRGQDEAFAEALTPNGTWRRSSTLLRVRFKGEPQVLELNREQAKALVTRWYALGDRDDIPQDLRDAPPE